MTYRESNVGTCDICLDTDAFITDADDDNNICDKCLDLQMSKDLEEIETDRGAFQPQPNEPTIDELLSGTSCKAIASNVILGMTAAFISGALFMAAILLDNAEVAAYTAAVLGGK